MSAGMTTVRRVVLRSGIVPVTLIVLAAGLGSVVPAQASARVPVAGSPLPGSSPGGGTAYVLNDASDTVTPISTATNTAGTPIPVNAAPDHPSLMAMTPDGKTVYVLYNNGYCPCSSPMFPIATATNTAGPPIEVGDSTAIVFTPDGKTAYVVGDAYVSSSAPYIPGYVIPVTTATSAAGPRSRWDMSPVRP